MRVLTLEINAFGSYKNHQVIDFTELEEESIFLITGPTGAGKTTIFDAICYGLYGKASGSERDQEAFRSHFSSEDDYTSVKLTFSIKGREYRIERSPKQWKKKTRGDGFTEEPANAAFYTQTPEQDWKLEATKINEVNEAIEQLIGLDYEQFKKMIMIPQGEFRKLISENSREREEVLQKIFHTSFYRKITERLKEQSTELRSEIQQFENDIKQQFDKAGLEDTDAPTLEDIELLINSQLEHKKQLEQLDNTLLEKLKTEQKRYSEKQQLNGYFEEYREKQEEYGRLQDKKDDYETWIKTLDKANRAEKVRPAAFMYHDRLREWEEQKKATEELLAKRDMLQKNYDDSKKKYEEEKKKENLRDEKKRQWQKYQEVANQLEDYENTKLTLNRIELSIKENTTQLNNIEQQIEELQQKDKVFSDLSSKIQAITQAIELKHHELTTMRQKEADFRDILKLKEEINELDKSLSEEQTIFQDAQQLFKQQTDKVSKIEEKHKQNIAIVLADSLRDGEECPVCGSTHHPIKAEENHHDEVENLLEEESEKLLSLEQELKKREHQVMLLTEQLRLKNEFAQQMAMKLEEIELPLSIELLEGQLDRIQLQVKAYLKETNQLENERNHLLTQQQQLQDELNQIDRLETKHKEILNEREQLSIEHREAEQRYFRLEAYLPRDFHSVESFLHETKSIQKQYEQLETLWKDVQTEYENIRGDFEKINIQYEQAAQYETQLYQRFYQQEQVFHAQLKDHGFENETTFKAALINPSSKETLEQQVKQYEEELQFVIKRIQTLKEQIADKEQPNLSLIEDSINKLQQQREENIRELQSIEMKIKDLQQITLTIQGLMENSKELSQQYYHVGELAGLAAGDNSMRLSFERYVLSTFLDEILLQANLRLSQMTDHRYQLIRSQGLAKRGAQSGLDLEVFDHYTGKQRSVKTLSGGEGFKASLSLALGMADTIQAHAGGIQLDMLFIDEGFGTLDERSLEQAISCLKLLQENNRVLGIISHVPRLREEIRAKLMVESTVDGSKAYFKI